MAKINGRLSLWLDEKQGVTSPLTSAFHPQAKVGFRPKADIDLTSCRVLASGSGLPEDAA